MGESVENGEFEEWRVEWRERVGMVCWHIIWRLGVQVL